MTEDQSQTPATAHSTEGSPTGTQPLAATVTTPVAPVDNAPSNAQPTPEPNQSPTTAAVGHPGTGLDVGQQVNTPDGYKQYVADVLSGKVQVQVPSDKVTPPAAAPEAAPEVVPENPEDDDFTQPEQKGKRPAVKVPLPEDPDLANLQSQTMRIMRERNRNGVPITPSEAETLARQVLGIPVTAPTPPEGPTAAPTTPSEAKPQTAEEVGAKIAELVAQKAAKNQNFQFEDDVAIEAELEALRDLKTQLIIQGHSAKAEAETLETAWQTSRTQAAQQYAGVDDPNSTLNIIARHIESEWSAAGDPRLASSDAPLLLYQAAAKSLALPAKAPVQSPASPPSQPVSRPSAAVLLASGSAGTSTAPQASGVQEFKITNPADYMATLQQLQSGTARYATPKRM